MQAHVGDWIDLPAGPAHPHPRRGLIVGVNHGDGTSPYRVRWLDEEPAAEGSHQRSVRRACAARTNAGAAAVAIGTSTQTRPRLRS